MVQTKCLLIALLAFVSTSIAHGTPWEDLLRESHNCRSRASQTTERQKELRNICLEPWYCIGPFKEGLFSNITEVFKRAHGPEAEVLARGLVPPDFSRVFTVEQLPGMQTNQRHWTLHSEWTDGYRHLLPRGPAPSRSEVVYLYRTIRADVDTEVEVRFYAEDYLRLWLNGQCLGQSERRYGPSRFPSHLVLTLPLKQGANRLFIKVASIHAAHGFSFALDGVTPSQELLPGQWSAKIHRNRDGEQTQENFTPLDQPFISMREGKHDYQIGDTVALCRSQLAEHLELPPDTVAQLTRSLDLTELQTLTRRALKRADSLRRLREFRVEMQMTPMFAPPDSLMYQLLDTNLSESPAARKYGQRRKELGDRIDRALALSGGTGTDESQVTQAAQAIEEFWRIQAAELPPIVYLKRPSYSINAIAPYSIRGARPSSICSFDPNQPDQPPRVIFHDPTLAIYDINLSWDARTVFFSAQEGQYGCWQLYEIGIDGKNLKRITDNADADYVSPCELPSGDLVYVSTQANTWVQCQGRKAGLLYVCRRDGSYPRKLSANIDSDHSPQVTDDGRIMFTRWDYGIEKNVFARHALWTINPDGTGFRLFFGNTIEDPAGFWKARQIPGSPAVVCVFGPHHTNQAGMLGTVWNRLGPEAPRGRGFRFITDEIPSYCDTSFQHGYQDPFPLHERLFLVSYGGDGGQQNRIYLIDDHGNKKCLFEAADQLSCYYPIPIVARSKPPVRVPECQEMEWVYRDPVQMNQQSPDDQWGTLMVQDVYQGMMPHIQRGEAKYIQVVEQVQKSRCMAGGEAWGHTPIIGRGTVHARRVIGRVPIEEDGSAQFQVPALRSISLNLLDGDGKTLMRMGSDMHVMPGETRGCVGCHENRGGAVAPVESAWTSLATRKHTAKPSQEDWGTAGLLDYQKVVQPIWDRHCIGCHGGATPEAGLSLSGDRTRFFSVSYDNLIDRGWVDFTNVFALDHDETTPKSVGAIVSRLLPYLDESHCGTKLDFEERYRVFAWIDANVPYYSTYTYTKVRGIGARDSWETDTGQARDGWMVGHVCQVFDRRCMSCHETTVNNQALYGSKGARVSSQLWTVRGVTAHVFPGRYPISAKYGPEFRINLTNPADSLLLQAPLSKAAGGLGYCRQDDGNAVFADRQDSDYLRMLAAIETGKRHLYQTPRVDMSPEHVQEVIPTVQSEETLAAFLPKLSATLSEGLRQLDALPTDKPNLARAGRGITPRPELIEGSPPRVSAEAATDGDPTTYWDEMNDNGPYRYQVKLPSATRISAISIVGWRHQDFAPRSFEIRCDGKPIGSVQLARYRDNRLTVTFPAMECSELELVIREWYGGSPAIRELELYDL